MAIINVINHTKPMKVAPKITLIEAFQRAVECALLSDDLSINAESIRPWLRPHFLAVPKALLQNSVKRMKIVGESDFKINSADAVSPIKAALSVQPPAQDTE